MTHITHMTHMTHINALQVTTLRCGMPIWKVPLPAPVKILHIACGNGHIALLTDQYQLLTWGDGRKGQLGHGTFKSKQVR